MLVVIQIYICDMVAGMELYTVAILKPNMWCWNYTMVMQDVTMGKTGWRVHKAPLSFPANLVVLLIIYYY